jgi:nucleotide-binding universal stress UspA family protein
VFRSIVVPVDESPASDRGLAIALGMARRAALPVRLVSVREPSCDVITAELDLRDRAIRAFPVACTTTVVLDDDVEGALVRAIAERPDSFVVLGTRARRAVGELLLGGVAEALLVRSDRPLVLVGPHVDADSHPCPQNLVIAVDSETTAAALVPPVVEWTKGFGGRPWVVQVAAKAKVPSGPSDTAVVHRTAAALTEAGIEAEWDLLSGDDLVSALISFTKRLGGGVLAVATRRWADPRRIHWSSTARELVHRSPYPVLVLPLHDR